MPKNAKDEGAGKRRTSIKDLPQASKELTGQDLKRVKGGVSDGTSNTLMLGEKSAAKRIAPDKMEAGAEG